MYCKIWLYTRQFALIRRLLLEDIEEVKAELFRKINEYLGENDEYNSAKLDSKLKRFQDACDKDRKIVALRLDIFRMEHKDEDLEVSEEYLKLVAEEERLRSFDSKVSSLKNDVEDLQTSIQTIQELLEKKASYLL